MLRKMSKRTLNLNDEELPLLAGKIWNIDVQDGCVEQCVICGADAPKYHGSMEWDLFERICNGIAEIKESQNVNLLGDSVAPFRRSNPVHYHSFSGGVERTLFDIVERLTNTHGKEVIVTIAGWKPGDNYMQLAMEKIVEHGRAELLHKMFQKSTDWHKHRLILTLISYSVKTAGALARADYLRFLKSLLGSTDVETVVRNSDKIRNHFSDFIEQSRYVHQLTEN